MHDNILASHAGQGIAGVNRKKTLNAIALSTDKTDADTLLSVLGKRVRALRAHRGVTRKTLAERSRVSERYLAQLEQGRGNISVVLLARVAAALGTDVNELLRGDQRASAELTLINDLLRDLDPDQHKAALALLADQFEAPLASRRRVALIGLRGAGKTSQGSRLAKRLGVPFVHIGTEIEKLAGMSTSEVFSLSGQTGYRRLEEQALMQALKRFERCVLETGGSIVLDSGMLNTLLTSCFVVWLHARPEQYMQRLVEQGDVRPMQNHNDAMSDLRKILGERESYYAKAHASLDTSSSSVEECVEALFRMVPEAAHAADSRDA